MPSPEDLADIARKAIGIARAALERSDEQS